MSTITSRSELDRTTFIFQIPEITAETLQTGKSSLVVVSLSSVAAFDFSSSSMATCVSSTTSLPFHRSPRSPLTIPHPLWSSAFYPPPHCRFVVLRGWLWLLFILYGRLCFIRHLIAAVLSSLAAFDSSSSSMATCVLSTTSLPHFWHPRLPLTFTHHCSWNKWQCLLPPNPLPHNADKQWVTRNKSEQNHLNCCPQQYGLPHNIVFCLLNVLMM